MLFSFLYRLAMVKIIHGKYSYLKIAPAQAGAVAYFSNSANFGGGVAVALKMQDVHFEVSLQAAQTFSALIFWGRQITNASTAFPMLVSIAQARRRIATAASSERLGPYIFFVLLFNKLFEKFYCLAYSIAYITLAKIIVIFGYVRQGKTVYPMAGYVYIFVVYSFHD
jgi:hypothetical protein